MPRKTGIYLQRRDLAILEQLAARRVETLEYLHDRHFTALSRKAAVNRLGDLVAHGYLVRVPITGHDGQYAGERCCATAPVTTAEC